MILYRNHKNLYIIVSSSYNNGTGAIICNITRPKSPRLFRCTPCVIENNDAGDIFPMPQDKLIQPTQHTVDQDEVQRLLTLACTHYQTKTKDFEPFKSNVIAITRTYLHNHNLL